MENIGVIAQKPEQNESGKWNFLDVYYDTDEDFNQATSKMINILYKSDSDGKCIATDDKGNKYLLELIHSTYDTSKNKIRIFPHNCDVIISPDKKIKKELN